MFKKTLFALAVGLVLAGGGSVARAGIDLDISVNLGYGGFYGRNISCATGKRIVDRRFNRVRAYDCSGRIYGYTGRRNGKWYYVSVSARSGYIVDVRRWK